MSGGHASAAELGLALSRCSGRPGDLFPSRLCRVVRGLCNLICLESPCTSDAQGEVSTVPLYLLTVGGSELARQRPGAHREAGVGRGDHP